jgi:hypothetical protein
VSHLYCVRSKSLAPLTLNVVELGRRPDVHKTAGNQHRVAQRGGRYQHHAMDVSLGYAYMNDIIERHEDLENVAKVKIHWCDLTFGYRIKRPPHVRPAPGDGGVLPHVCEHEVAKLPWWIEDGSVWRDTHDGRLANPGDDTDRPRVGGHLRGAGRATAAKTPHTRML